MVSITCCKGPTFAALVDAANIKSWGISSLELVPPLRKAIEQELLQPVNTQWLDKETVSAGGTGLKSGYSKGQG